CCANDASSPNTHPWDGHLHPLSLTEHPLRYRKISVMTDAALYPVFLKLDGVPVLVVGGGTVAAAKLDGLLAAGARVTVVAPRVLDAIRARVPVLETTFLPAHLAGVRWVVAAATPEVNREVVAAATARGLFVNAVDEPAV